MVSHRYSDASQLSSMSTEVSSMLALPQLDQQNVMS